MSYKNRLQYTSFGQRRRELRSLAQKYLEKEASRCEEFALYTKKELRHYIARFLKKIHQQLSGIRGALLLSLLILYHCAGSPAPDPVPMDDPPPVVVVPPPPPTPPVPPMPPRIFIANFGQINQVYKNDGAGGFTSGSDISFDSNDSYSIAVGDLNGDGRLDIVVANYTEKNRVYLDDGMGGFTGSDISSDEFNSSSIALGDLDGDGDLDIVVANYDSSSSGRPNRVYKNDGTGSFTGTDLSSELNKSNSIALGDIDGDGDLDIVVANYGSSSSGAPNRVYKNDGMGSFTGTDLSSELNDSYSIALDDLDGDGDLDIVVADYGSVNRVYKNDGMGVFTGSNISSDSSDSSSIALGDLDGDGDLDIVVANYGQVNRVYNNDGMGVFTGSNISTDVNFSNSIALGDLDDDGDLDIVVANEPGINNRTGVNRVYKNDGMGVFTSGSDISTDTNDSESIVIK